MAVKKTWYVEATGHTNEAIAAELPSENAHRGILCQDGAKRDFWQCEYQFVSMLLKNEEVNHLHFKVFCRDGKYGPVKPWLFLRGKKKRKKPSAQLDQPAKEGPQAAT